MSRKWNGFVKKRAVTKEIARSNGMLNNEKFVSKAPAAKVQEEKDKLEKYQQMMDQVKERLEGIKSKDVIENTGDAFVPSCGNKGML